MTRFELHGPGFLLPADPQGTSASDQRERIVPHDLGRIFDFEANRIVCER